MGMLRLRMARISASGHRSGVHAERDESWPNQVQHSALPATTGRLERRERIDQTIFRRLTLPVAAFKLQVLARRKRGCYTRECGMAQVDRHLVLYPRIVARKQTLQAQRPRDVDLPWCFERIRALICKVVDGCEQPFERALLLQIQPQMGAGCRWKWQRRLQSVSGSS